MPNTKSAIRRVRRVKIQTVTNKIRKSKLNENMVLVGASIVARNVI